MHSLDFGLELRELISSQRVLGRSGKVFEGLGSLSSPNTLSTLRSLFWALKPERSLEVGFCFGASALLFTGLYAAAGKPPNRQHVALDPFQSSIWDDAGLVQIERAGLIRFLDFRSAYSRIELPRLLEQGAHFDLIYIDGSHLFEDVFVDAFYCSRLVSEGGVVAFDDCSNPHVAKVIRFIQRNGANALSEVELGPYRETGRASFGYRVARLLDRVQMRAFRRIGEVERLWNAPFRRF